MPARRSLIRIVDMVWVYSLATTRMYFWVLIDVNRSIEMVNGL